MTHHRLNYTMIIRKTTRFCHAQEMANTISNHYGIPFIKHMITFNGQSLFSSKMAICVYKEINNILSTKFILIQRCIHVNLLVCFKLQKMKTLTIYFTIKRLKIRLTNSIRTILEGILQESCFQRDGANLNDEVCSEWL